MWLHTQYIHMHTHAMHVSVVCVCVHVACVYTYVHMHRKDSVKAYMSVCAAGSQSTLTL